MDAKSMGNKIRKYRVKCGWSIMNCAERIGISTRYLADIEHGKKVPRLETFLDILNTFTASADDVLQDSLICGYEDKSNYLSKMLESLEVTKRNKALDIFTSIISTLKEN